MDDENEQLEYISPHSVASAISYLNDDSLILEEAATLADVEPDADQGSTKRKRRQRGPSKVYHKELEYDTYEEARETLNKEKVSTYVYYLVILSFCTILFVFGAFVLYHISIATSVFYLDLVADTVTKNGGGPEALLSLQSGESKGSQAMRLGRLHTSTRHKPPLHYIPYCM